VKAILKKEQILNPRVREQLNLLLHYTQNVLKERPYRLSRIAASELVAKAHHATTNGAYLARNIRELFLYYRDHWKLPPENRGGPRDTRPKRKPDSDQLLGQEGKSKKRARKSGSGRFGEDKRVET
jgi:hypothetical protein